MSSRDDFLPESLRAYVQQVEQALERAGVEASVRLGIIRDLEGQIGEMRAEEGMADAEVLASLDAPEVFVETYAGKHPVHDSAAIGQPGQPDTATPAPDKRGRIVYILVALLAGVAIATEAVTHMCALQFLDPMPTYLHLALLIPVPFALVTTSWFLARGTAARHAGWLYCINGFLVAVSLAYALLFLPLMPMAAFAVMYLGLGLLPLSPAAVLIASVCQAMQLLGQPDASRPGRLRRRWLAGFGLTVLLLGGWHGYTVLLDHAMEKAASSRAEEREAGLDTLRSLWGESYVLQHCFASRPRLWGERGDASASRITYYRLTGQEYHEAEKPFGYFSPDGNGDAPVPNAGWEKHRLSLRSAVYDISIASADDGGNAGPGVAYAELTLEFVNSGADQAEARCQIAMPPGGVASRLTLWIDGEEREAAFGKQSTVREAYTRVVYRQLDPALLTTAGPDRVELRCFPVMPSSVMRVKVGFSLPLSPRDGSACLQLPYIAERNFAFVPGQNVSLWAECDAPMMTNSVLYEAADPSLFAKSGLSAQKAYVLRRRIAAEDLAKARISLPLPDAPATFAAALSGFAADSRLVREEPLPERLVAVVLESSRQYEALWKPGGAEAMPWQRILQAAPAGCRVALFAGDVSVPPLSAEEAARRWPEALAKAAYVTVDEQASNLEKAWDLCDGTPQAAVLWLHGPLPVDIADAVGLEQRLRHRPPSENGPVIYSLPIRPGENLLERKLASLAGFVRLPVWPDETVGEQLAFLFATMNYPDFARERYVYQLREGESGSEETRYGHVVRLAAADAVVRQLAKSGGKPGASGDAVANALRLRIVTPATGAVVLENAAQYAENDLDPAAAADAVPTIPEPEEWAMLALAAACVVVLHCRRKRKGAAA